MSVAPEDDIFASVNGSHKWTPWLIFAAFALALLAAFALLWRVLRNASSSPRRMPSSTPATAS